MRRFAVLLSVLLVSLVCRRDDIAAASVLLLVVSDRVVARRVERPAPDRGLSLIQNLGAGPGVDACAFGGCNAGMIVDAPEIGYREFFASRQPPS
jgi:hypothetical protein